MIGATASQLRSLIYVPTSYVERIDLTRLFPQAQPLEVELGSGDGSFLVEWARCHPERNFLAVERLLGRIRKLDRKALRARLSNLRAIRLEAGYCLEYLVPSKSIGSMHIYFPDPWPKRKHRKHRLINTHFAEIAAQKLTTGGVIYLRTDDADYFRQMVEVFGHNRNLQPVETPPELAGVLTDFERGFQARGVRTLAAAYALK